MVTGFSSASDDDNGKKMKPRRTIREWLDYRKPDFDPASHELLINDSPYDGSLDDPLGPLDRLSVVAKAEKDLERNAT